jgi:hypothetical protein
MENWTEYNLKNLIIKYSKNFVEVQLRLNVMYRLQLARPKLGVKMFSVNLKNKFYWSPVRDKTYVRRFTSLIIIIIIIIIIIQILLLLIIIMIIILLLLLIILIQILLLITILIQIVLPLIIIVIILIQLLLLIIITTTFTRTYAPCWPLPLSL